MLEKFFKFFNIDFYDGVVLWTAFFVDIIDSLIGILSFTKIYPGYGFNYRAYFIKKCISIKQEKLGVENVGSKSK